MHTVFCGGDDSNPRGEAIVDLIATYPLEVENRGFKPTFIGRGTATHIDITLTLNCEIQDWQVMNEVTLSGHNLICFNYALQLAESELVPNLKMADWHIFLDNTEKSPDPPPDIITSDWMDNEAALLIGLLQKGLTSACPIVKISNKI